MGQESSEKVSFLKYRNRFQARVSLPILSESSIIKSAGVEAFLSPAYLLMLRYQLMPYPSLIKMDNLTEIQIGNMICRTVGGMKLAYLYELPDRYESLILYPEALDWIFKGLTRRSIDVYMTALLDYSDRDRLPGILCYSIDSVFRTIRSIDRAEKGNDVYGRIKEQAYIMLNKSLRKKYQSKIRKVLRSFV